MKAIRGVSSSHDSSVSSTVRVGEKNSANQSHRPEHHFARILLLSFVVTLAIFVGGVLLNYGLDVLRLNTILHQMVSHEISSQAFLVEQDFLNTVDGNTCIAISQRIADLKEQTRLAGGDLASYSGLSMLRKKDFDYLKRKYILLQLRFFTLVQSLNQECDDAYIPVLFFYKIDDEQSERQGFVLEDLARAFPDTVIVLNLDKDYKDEGLVGLLTTQYNVTSAPTVIIGNRSWQGLVYEGELNSTVRSILQRPDPYAPVDFEYVLRSAGVNKSMILNDLQLNLSGGNVSMPGNTVDAFAEGDRLLVHGRLSDSSFVCAAGQEFDKVLASNDEEAALVAETKASLGCGRNRRAFLLEAAKKWRILGVGWRAAILEDLAFLRKPVLRIEPAVISPALLVPANASVVILGNSSLVLRAGDVVATQVDRVRRDWLGGQLSQSPFGQSFLKVFSERRTYSAENLREDVGWHEGGRMSQLATIAGIISDAVTGTMIAEKDGRWYAPDEIGVFRFEVPLDKLSYPTTRFLRKNLGVIIDTHGVNMLVEQSIRHNVTAVVSDCDHPGKVAAAAYLSSKNIPVVCLPDKYAYLALGQGIDLLANPPFLVVNKTAVIGGRPFEIRRGQSIVVQNATALPYALWYYQNPSSYFSALSESFPLNLSFVQVSDFNQTERVIAKARELKARIIGVRVFNRNDYEAVSEWLREDPLNSAVLFHSISYPYGYLIFTEFPLQTTFGDVNPVFV